LYSKNKTINEIQSLKDELENVPSEELIDIKAQENECQKEWLEKIGKVSKFTSAEARKKSESDYIQYCLKNK